ncbi:MAG: tetratricopeptide repeat protein [Acidobacteriota bacterium]
MRIASPVADVECGHPARTRRPSRPAAIRDRARRPIGAGGTPALLLLVLLACRGEQPAPPPPAKPDIILVTIDTLRADALGFAGNADVKTPFLDRMASEGIVFNNAHAQNVVTLPSHANILTGLYPYQHGIRDNAGFKLDAQHETVATMLRRAGYVTGAFVGAFPLDARFGLNQGFDVYDDNYGKGAASLDFVIQERPAAAVLDSAVHWWETNEGRKRFLWVHLYDPHAPYRPPAPFDAQYAADPYLGEIAAVDDALAKALDPVISTNRTILLIVTADHGEARGDHGELTHGLFAYEPTLKVPLIVRPSPGPSGHPLPPGGRGENGYVRHIDIVPTILEAAGIAKPKELPGASLLGPIGARDTYFESLSASINRGWAPLTGIIHRGAKYIDLPIAELYDLPRDPGEKNNLRAERRRDVEAARKLLPPRGVASRSVSAEEAAQLRSLGYLGGSGSTKTTFTAADDPKSLVALDNKMHDVVAAYESHDLPRALKLAKEVVAARPDMAAGRELLAFVLQQHEQIGEAIANLRAAMKSGQQTEGIRVQLGLLLTETGKTDEAVKILAPLASGTNPDALNAYGVALADQGKLDEATALFQRILQLDANNAPALQNLGIVALRRDDVGAAQANLARALALNPRLPLALNTMGVVFARQNDFAHAVEMWNRAVEVDPRQYDALFNTGLVEARAGHAAEARAALERFIETAPKSRYGKDIETARQALATLN